MKEQLLYFYIGLALIQLSITLPDNVHSCNKTSLYNKKVELEDYLLNYFQQIEKF